MPDNQPEVQTQDAQSTQSQIPSPEQTQDQTQAQPASLFQSAMAPAIQQPSQPVSTVSQVQRPPDDLQSHPAVQKASVLHRVAETLAGGPKIRTTYNDDGSVNREPVPLTSKEILTGAVANILGALGQAGQAGVAASQHRAPPVPQPLPTQVAQQQRDQQSAEDFDRIQTQKVRQAKVIEANLNAMKAAYAVGKEDDAAKDAYVTNHSADLERYQKSGIVEASQIPSDQLMQKSFDKSKYTVIPDGKVPVYLPSGERATNSDGVPLSQLTYSVVDGTTQTPLTQENYDQYVKYGLMKSSPTFKLPEGATVSTATQAMMKNKIDLLGQTQREIDEVAGDGKIDLAARLRENPSLLKDIENFHNDAASQDPLTQLQNVRAKHPASAGAMVDLFGGQPVLDAYAAKNQTADDLTADKAQSIISDPKTDKTSPAYQKAVSFLKNARTQKAQTAADETTAKQQAESDSSDVQETARNIVSGDLARLSDVVSRKGEDRRAMMNAILVEAKSQGKDPADYGPTALETKSKMYEDYRNGKTSNNIAAFDAFLGHANDAMDANDAWRRSGSPLINKPMSWLAKNATNDQNYIAFDTSLEPVRKEFMSFLNANRAEHAEDLKTMQTILNTDNSPAQVETALKQLGKSADIRLAAIGRKYQNMMGTPFPNLVSDEGKQTLSRMGIQSKSAGQAPQNQQPSPQNGQSGNHPFFSKFGGKADQQ